MRPTTRLLGSVLGLARPRPLPSSLPSPSFLRPYSGIDLSTVAEEDLDRPVNDLVKENHTQKLGDRTRLFPHFDFTPSLALMGERDFYFPPESGEARPRVDIWPTPPEEPPKDSVKFRRRMERYKTAYNAYKTVEKTLVRELKSHKTEDTEIGENVRQTRLDFAAEEEKKVSKLNNKQKAEAEKRRVEKEAEDARRRRLKSMKDELVNIRVMAAVPWTSDGFLLSRALEADAWVQLPGVDVSGEKAAKALEAEQGKKKSKRSRKKMTVEEREEEARLEEDQREKEAAAEAAKTWLNIIFPVPPSDIRLEDWNAAIQYYSDLEIEVAESELPEFNKAQKEAKDRVDKEMVEKGRIYRRRSLVEMEDEEEAGTPIAA